MPSRQDLEAMGKFNEELIKAGVMKDAAGLQPSSKGARVSFAGGAPTVTDGPFVETKELIAGYWVIEVKSRAEAIEWAKRVPFGTLPHDGREPELEDRLRLGGGASKIQKQHRDGKWTARERIAHLADSFRLRAEVHGPTEPAVHLCMAIPNCTYYESLVTSNPATRESRVGPDGFVLAPTEPGIALPDFAHEYRVRRAPKPRTSTKEPLGKERT